MQKIKREKTESVICFDRKGNKFEVLKNKLTFRPSIYGIVVKDKKILLSRQWDGYDFPGGGVELGETIEEALKREFKEETGFEVKLTKIIACENSFFKLPFKGSYVQSILMYYFCKIVGGKLSTDFFSGHENEYVQKAEWIEIKNIGKIKFYNSIDNKKIFEKIKESYE
jgi:ADP-ribose pyrophosphatase YjhB (NUDIX family)